MDATAALRYLQSFGFCGVCSGNTEFYCTEDKISIEIAGGVETITADEFISAYGHWDFRKLDTEDFNKNTSL